MTAVFWTNHFFSEKPTLYSTEGSGLPISQAIQPIRVTRCFMTQAQSVAILSPHKVRVATEQKTG